MYSVNLYETSAAHAVDTLISAGVDDEILMAEETTGAWLHLTGDPWMTPEDILSDRLSSLTLNDERPRIGRSRDSVDTLPPYSPQRILLPSPKQDFDVESETLPPPLLSPTSRKQNIVAKSYSESTKRIRRSQGGHIRVPSKSKPRIARMNHNTLPSTTGSQSAGMLSFHGVGQGYWLSRITVMCQRY